MTQEWIPVSERLPEEMWHGTVSGHRGLQKYRWDAVYIYGRFWNIHTMKEFEIDGIVVLVDAWLENKREPQEVE